jgi:hypothetical protein
MVAAFALSGRYWIRTSDFHRVSSGIGPRQIVPNPIADNSTRLQARAVACEDVRKNACFLHTRGGMQKNADREKGKPALACRYAVPTRLTLPALPDSHRVHPAG